MGIAPSSYRLQLKNGMTVELLGPEYGDPTVEATLRCGSSGRLEERTFGGGTDDELVEWLDRKSVV